MKHYVFLIYLLSAAWYLPAQIIITSTDLPSAGDTLRYSMSVQFQEFDFTTGNAQHQWDFGGLQHISQGIEDYRTVTSVNWFLGTFVFPSSMAIQALPDLPLEDFGLEPEDFWSVFKKTNSLYTQEGFFMIYQGLPLPLKYSQADRIYNLPLEYDHQSSHPFSGIISLGDTLSLSREGVRTTHADAWGTLTTPYGTFETLRLKVVLWEKDSLYWQTLEQPLTLERTTTRYVWLAKNEKLPVLEASYIQFFDEQEPALFSIRYRDIYREPLQTEAPVADFTAQITEVNINELIHLQNLSTPDHDVNHYIWSYSPATPSFHEGTHNNSVHPIISFPAAGSYTVQLEALNDAGQDIITRVQYLEVKDPLSSPLVNPYNLKPSWYITRETLWLQNAPEDGTIAIFDMQGRLLLRQGWKHDAEPSVNITSLKSGIYIVQIRSGISGAVAHQGLLVNP